MALRQCLRQKAQLLHILLHLDKKAKENLLLGNGIYTNALIKCLGFTKNTD